MQPLTEEHIIKDESREPAPDACLEKKDRFSMLFALVDKLSDKQKEVVCLKFQSNMSYKEISETTGNSVSNVGFILHSAMSELKSMMPKEV